MTEQSTRRRRGGGRAGNTRRGGAAIEQLDWHLPEVSDAPTEPLTPEGVEAIHGAAMRIPVCIKKRVAFADSQWALKTISRTASPALSMRVMPLPLSLPCSSVT